MFAKATIEVLRIKQHVSLRRLAVRWGNTVDYKAVQPGAVCSPGIQDSSTLRLFKIPREVHIASTSVCF